jgi:hypothetical protein
MSTLSKKHHYIPQFYLRGFTGDDGYFTIYDKQLNTFRKSRPENEFYEKNRNTTNLGGEKSVFVENMYSHLESVSAITIAAIEKSTHTDKIINLETIIGLKFFVETMRWRNPALDELYSTIVPRLSVEDFGLKLYGGTTQQQAEIKARMMNEPDIHKMLRSFMAAMGLNSTNEEPYNDYKWNITYHDGGFPITGDFPIIFNPSSVNEGLDSEFILPLSSNRTVIVSPIRKVKQLPDTFSIEKDLAMIHLAKRFVCCKRDDYLKFMVNYYKVHQDKINDKFLEKMFLDLSK